MKKTFYEINKAIRTQIRSRREFKNLTQQDLRKKIGKDFFGDENHFENDKTIITRLESIPKEQDKNELRNIDFELLYYVCYELELKLDSIFFPKENPSLFEKNFLENSISEKIYNIKLTFLKEIYKKNNSFIKNLTDEKITVHYNNLLQSGLRTFLPAQISFISVHGAGTTSLIYLLLGLKCEENNLLPQNQDVFYLHSEYKPPFYPKEKNEFEFDKDSFCLEEIFTYRNNFDIQASNKITVKFIDANILKYVTIFDTKFNENNLPMNLLEDSEHFFIVDSEPDFRSKQISKIITILAPINNNSDSYSNKYILNKINILVSKKSFLLKKDEERIKSLIYKDIKAKEPIKINLKEILYQTVLNSFISYDITNPESYYRIRNLLKDIIKNCNNPVAISYSKDLYEWKALPLDEAPLNVITPIYQIQRYFNHVKMNVFFTYCRQFPEFLNGLIIYCNIISNNITNTINTFINDKLNIEFIKGLDFIEYKNHTNCLNISKEFITKLIKCINNEIYIFILSIFWKHGLIDKEYIKAQENFNKYNFADSYRPIIFYTIEKILDSKDKNTYINEYIEDITNANRPTTKYFVKRFIEYKNKNNMTLAEKLSDYLKTIIIELKMQLNLINEEYSYISKDSVKTDMETYIELYEEFVKMNREIKNQIKEKCYPNVTFMDD